VGQLAKAIQEVVEEPVQVAFVDQGYTGEKPARDAAGAGLQRLILGSSGSIFCHCASESNGCRITIFSQIVDFCTRQILPAYLNFEK